MPDRKFSLTQILNDDPKVITAELEKEFSKKPKRKGGDNMRNSTLKAILQAHELTITKLNRIEQMLEAMRK